MVTNSDIEDRTYSPSLAGESRPITPAMSEASIFSPHGTEDSFFHFMSRMVQLYVREEEVRGRHQAALLHLRENALKERTKVSQEYVYSPGL